jgi:hypothetical protein
MFNASVGVDAKLRYLAPGFRVNQAAERWVVDTAEFGVPPSDLRWRCRRVEDSKPRGFESNRAWGGPSN